MQIEENDAAYKQWLKQNHDGFVLNYNVRNPNPHYLMLHRADCHTIQPSVGRRWTYKYGKYCRPGRLAVEKWAKDNGHAPAQPCGHCLSG